MEGLTAAERRDAQVIEVLRKLVVVGSDLGTKIREIIAKARNQCQLLI